MRHRTTEAREGLQIDFKIIVPDAQMLKEVSSKDGREEARTLRCAMGTEKRDLQAVRG